MATLRAASKPSSSTVRLNLRPLTPPFALISCTAASRPALKPAPEAAAPPLSGSVAPILIVLLVTPCAFLGVLLVLTPAVPPQAATSSAAVRAAS